MSSRKFTGRLKPVRLSSREPVFARTVLRFPRNTCTLGKEERHNRISRVPKIDLQGTTMVVETLIMPGEWYATFLEQLMIRIAAEICTKSSACIQYPLDFLNHLKRHKKAIPIYTVVGFHKDWIREEDILALIRLFDSKEPCASVVSAYSSFTPSRSTVGQEAAYMVYSFFLGVIRLACIHGLLITRSSSSSGRNIRPKNSC